MIYIYFIFRKPHIELLCPGDGGRLILKEATPIRVERFHHGDHWEINIPLYRLFPRTMPANCLLCKSDTPVIRALYDQFFCHHINVRVFPKLWTHHSLGCLFKLEHFNSPWSQTWGDQTVAQMPSAQSELNEHMDNQVTVSIVFKMQRYVYTV